MPDYAKLYHRMFNSATDAIEILKKAQQDSEQMFMDSPEPEVRVLKSNELPDNKPPETK